MIRLPYAGTYSLELITAQNGAQVVVCYSDKTATAYTGGAQATSITSATTTKVCDTPAASTIRDIDSIHIKNTYAGSHTVTVQVDVNGTNYPLVTASLLTDESLNYTHGSGWQAKDADGNTKTSLSSTMILPISSGGTGQATAQDAINALTAVSAATNEYVLTKDTATGNAVFKAAAGGGSGDFKADGSVPMIGDIQMGANGIEFEGSSADAYKTRLNVVNPTANRAINMPNASGTLAVLEAPQTFTASQRGTVTTDNDATFDQSVTNNFACTPTGAAALTFTNHTAGQSGFILLVNSSNYAISAAATTKISTADLAKISTTGTYIVSYFDNGTNAYCVTSGNLA